MLHIFADPADMQGDLLTVRGPEVNHMKNVLRMKPGDEVSVSDGRQDKDYRYVITGFQEDAAVLNLVGVEEKDTELPVLPYLFQGLPKGEKMELVIQKAVELGVYEIIPVSMRRCVAKLDEKRAEKKAERWQKVAEAAAMQSKRRVIPRIHMPMTMQEAIRYAQTCADVRVLPYENQQDDGSTKALLETLREPTPDGKKKGVAVFIGPEGGFEEEEVKEAREAGIQPISLGKRILRTETAGLMFLSWLTYLLEIS